MEHLQTEAYFFIPIRPRQVSHFMDRMQTHSNLNINHKCTAIKRWFTSYADHFKTPQSTFFNDAFIAYLYMSDLSKSRSRPFNQRFIAEYSPIIFVCPGCLACANLLSWFPRQVYFDDVFITYLCLHKMFRVCTYDASTNVF